MHHTLLSNFYKSSLCSSRNIVYFVDRIRIDHQFSGTQPNIKVKFLHNFFSIFLFLEQRKFFWKKKTKTFSLLSIECSYSSTPDLSIIQNDVDSMQAGNRFILLLPLKHINTTNASIKQFIDIEFLLEKYSCIQINYFFYAPFADNKIH